MEITTFLLFLAVAVGSAVGQERSENYEAPPQCSEINATLGESCNPQVDCKQCGYCDFFLHCNNDTLTWSRQSCDQKIQADGTILTKDKLFWNEASTDHGGICDLYENLGTDLQNSYKDDPNCKTICEFVGPVGGCLRRYTFREPDFKSGIWHSEPVTYNCPQGMEWDQSRRTCTFCGEGNDCDANC